jgi:hypothetical protein
MIQTKIIMRRRSEREREKEVSHQMGVANELIGSIIGNYTPSSAPDPVSGVFFYPLDLGSGSEMTFFRIPDPAPFFMKFSHIICGILVMVSLLNWATLKTYSSRSKKKV